MDHSPLTSDFAPGDSHRFGPLRVGRRKMG